MKLKNLEMCCLLHGGCQCTDYLHADDKDRSSCRNWRCKECHQEVERNRERGRKEAKKVSENKRIKHRNKDGSVPYGFSYGRMSGTKEGMKQYFPRPTSKSAQFLAVAQAIHGVPRTFFYDTSCVANLQNAGLLRLGKDSKLFLTKRGRYYLKTRDVHVLVRDFLMNDSWIRYIKCPLEKLVAKLVIGNRDWDQLQKIFHKDQQDLRRERRKKFISSMLWGYSHSMKNDKNSSIDSKWYLERLTSRGVTVREILQHYKEEK